MRKIPLAVWLTGIVIGYYVWSDYRNEGRIKRLLAGASNETYSAADIARWTAIVAKVQSGDRSVITPAVQEESKRIKTEIRTRHINKPASITPRDIQMLKLHD